jgi:hypothetical protein
MPVERSADFLSRYRKTPLVNRWLHSQEEDTATELVYRPAGFSFPAVTGRSGFELQPDGTVIWLGTGTEDAAGAENGIWVLEEGRPPTLIFERPSGTRRSMQIVSVDEEKLVVREAAGQSGE